jgi:hypothetical protein
MGSSRSSRTPTGSPSDGRDHEAAPVAVVRVASYDPDALRTGRDRMEAFERAHASQPGYAGNLVVDLGGGKRVMVTLWDDPEHAARARDALGPVVREQLGPLEREPSRLLGVGPVQRTDLVFLRRTSEPG